MADTGSDATIWSVVVRTPNVGLIRHLLREALLESDTLEAHVVRFDGEDDDGE